MKTKCSNCHVLTSNKFKPVKDGEIVFEDNLTYCRACEQAYLSDGIIGLVRLSNLNRGLKDEERLDSQGNIFKGGATP